MSISIGVLGDGRLDEVAEACSDWRGPVWIPESPAGLHPVLLAGALLQRNPELSIGFAVLISNVRHPWDVAQVAGSILAVSGKHPALGIGVGPAPLKRALGLSNTATVDGLKQSIGAVREQWPKTSKPECERPLILVGGEGDRMLDLAASSTDGVILPFLRTEPYLADRRARFEASRSALHTEPGRIVQEVVATVADSKEAAAQMLQPWLRFATRGPKYPDVLHEAGWDRASISAYLADPSQNSVPAEVLEKIAVIGNGEDVRRQLRRIRQSAHETIVVTPASCLPAVVDVCSEISRKSDRERQL